nr:hypothetical protein [uncultured Campylobacter sp.]
MKEKLIEKFGADLAQISQAELASYVQELALQEAAKALCELDDESKSAKSTQLILDFADELKDAGALSDETAEALLNGVKKALCDEDEQALYKLIYDYDDLRKKIACKQKAIKTLVLRSYDDLDTALQNASETEAKERIGAALQRAIASKLPLADVLKEASELAFISVLESGTDIEDTAHETAKNIAFSAIGDGEFTKFRTKEISKIIINRAIFVANESKNTAAALIRGAILGCYDGINKAAERYRDELSFSPADDAQSLGEKKLQISQMSELFSAVLSDAVASSEEPAKSEIAKIADEEFGGYLAKFRKISTDLAEQLSAKIGEIELGERAKKASAKAREITQELSQKSAKIIENLDLDEKLDAIKKELSEFEKKMSQKFAELKSSDVAKNVSERAREMSAKAYEAAKETIAKLKSKKD